jgi:hypothetical protein
LQAERGAQGLLQRRQVWGEAIGHPARDRHGRV